MGNCQSISICSSNKKTINPLPVDTAFRLPSPLPEWPPGGSFASGVIDIGGIQLRQVSSFKKVWATNHGGPGNLGVTFLEPYPIPDGFSMLGSYAQSNNQPLFGWVLVGKSNDDEQSKDVLAKPIDYIQVWTNSSHGEAGRAYFWLPQPPDGYLALGYVITTEPGKPSLDRIRCVQSDFTEESEHENWIWAEGKVESDHGVNVYGLRPKNRGTTAQGISVGTFLIQQDSITTTALPCLKANNLNLSYLPNRSQVEALFEVYSPFIYFHPREVYLPSSVNWYFENGALLYQKGEESTPIPIEINGSNLPQGGSNDDSYWLDLPVDESAKERVKKGDLPTAEAYLHIKPMLGATFTDIQVWIFYPFNGPATAKIGFINRLSLGKIGEHVGDWEHVALRISNFDGLLYKVYFGSHSGGQWVDSSGLEFGKGNKFVCHSSWNGHAIYNKEGLFLQGVCSIGLRNEAAKSEKVLDTGARFSVVSSPEGVAEPPWLNYSRKWGPKISYCRGEEVETPGKKRLLPNEVYGTEGPTGPKMKNVWNGDEK